MVRIAITEAAFAAIAATLPLGSVVYEPKLNEKGERLIWIERCWLDRLMAGIILRLVEIEANGAVSRVPLG